MWTVEADPTFGGWGAAAKLHYVRVSNGVRWGTFDIPYGWASEPETLRGWLPQAKAAVRRAGTYL